MAMRAALDLSARVPFCASDLGVDAISPPPRGEGWGDGGTGQNRVCPRDQAAQEAWAAGAEGSFLGFNLYFLTSGHLKFNCSVFYSH